MGLVANYAGQLWAAVMTVAFVPTYIAYLGMEAYGLIGVFSIVLACCTVLDAGMTPTLNREMARFAAGGHTIDSIADLTRSIEWICCVVLGTIVSAGLLSGQWLAVNWIGKNSLPVSTVSMTIVLMTAVAGLRLVEGVYRGALLGLQRHVWLNGMSSLLATLRGLGALAVLAWFSPTVGAFFVWQGVVSLATVSILGLAVWRALPRRERRPRLSLPALHEIKRFAGGMVAVTMLALLLTQMDKILLSRLLSLEAFAHYALAALLASSIAMLTTPIATVFYPRMTGLVVGDDKAALQEAYHRGSQLVSIITGSAAILLVVFGHALLLVWTGDPRLAAQAAPLLRVLAIGTLFNALMWMPYHLQLAHGWTSLTIRINVLAVATLVPLILFVAPRYGAIGTAWVWLGLNATYLTVGVTLMHRRLLPAAKWGWYLNDVAKPLFAACLAALLARWLAPDDLPRFEQIAVLALAAASTVAASASAVQGVRHTAMDGLRRTFRAKPQPS